MTSRLLRLALLFLLVAAIAVAVVYHEHFDVAELERWIQEAGIWAPLLFMVVFAVAAVLFLPGSVLTLAGGALFGPVLGTLYNLTGATLGATLAFLIARYLASDWVAQKTGGRLKQLINGDVRTAQDFVGEQGHIDVATNIPLEDLGERLTEISDYHERPVIAICRTDRKSGKAAEILAQKGFADVHVARRGMTAWNDLGYAVEH
jgi:rhodanese-related sulfurtransferase